MPTIRSYVPIRHLGMPTIRAYSYNRLVMRPCENLSAYGGVRSQGGRPKMPDRRQASLARSGLLHVENVFSPTTQASGFAAGPEFTPDVSSLAFLSGAIERIIWIGSKYV